MILALFILFQILVVSGFILSFFTKNEILWAMTLLLTGFMMFSSFDIEIPSYQFNTTIQAYQPVNTSYSYPYLMGINMMFFGLGLILAFLIYLKNIVKVLLVIMKVEI